MITRVSVGIMSPSTNNGDTEMTETMKAELTGKSLIELKAIQRQIDVMINAEVERLNERAAQILKQDDTEG